MDKRFYNIETSITKIDHFGADNEQIERLFATHSAAFRKDFTALDDKCNLAIDGLNEMKDEVDQLSTEINNFKSTKRTTYYEKPRLESELAKISTETVTRSQHGREKGQ